MALGGAHAPFPEAERVGPLPPMGMLPESAPGVREVRGLFPLPRFCRVDPRGGRGHSGTRTRRLAGRVDEANRILSRLETVFAGRLREEVDTRAAAAPSPCGRSVRVDAAAQVWEAVCTHDPPLPSKEGVDA